MASESSPAKPLLKLGHIAGRGRVFTAAGDIKPGEILLSESPLLLYPSPSSSSSSFCSHCFRRLPAAPIPCPSCPAFFFCSPLCLSSHSPSICRAISSLPPLPNPDLVSQSLFLLYSSTLSPTNFQILLSLDAGDCTAPTQDAAFLHSIVGPVTGFSLKVVNLLIEIDKRNAFGIMEPFRDGEERRVRAYGIYPNASFFNHDCLPNACRFDYVDRDGEGNGDIVVRAIHGIAEGGEVCLSYFPTNWGFEERQGKLMEEYGFRCVCDRCEVEKNWKEEEEEEEDEEIGEDLGDGNDDFPHAYFFLRYVCDKENCGGTLAPLPPLPEGSLSGFIECNVCGQVRKEDGFGGDDDGGNDDMMLVE